MTRARMDGNIGGMHLPLTYIIIFVLGGRPAAGCGRSLPVTKQVPVDPPHTVMEMRRRHAVATQCQSRFDLVANAESWLRLQTPSHNESDTLDASQ